MPIPPDVRLRRSDLQGPGYRRRAAGRGFAYYDCDGALIRDDRLDRIRGLAIPPAWRDVWICPWPNGHVQATGLDAAGRRQYRYHDKWRERRDAEKHERVLAAAIRLLDLGAFRVGGEQYAEDNGTYGLATLRREHVRVRGERVVFCYTAKGGQQREVELTDSRTAAVVRELLQRPDDAGEELLGYWEDGPEDGGPAGEQVWHDVTSAEVNAYLKEISGRDITAKDFRTWTATVLMAATLAETPQPASRTARKKAVRAAYSRVSEQLGNTPAVCRASYVDPRVVDRYEHGETIAPALDEAADAADDRAAQQVLEEAVCALLTS